MDIKITDHNIFFANNPELCALIEDRCKIKIVPIPVDAVMFKIGSKKIYTPPAIWVKHNVISDNEFSDEICSVIQKCAYPQNTLYGWSIVIHPIHEIKEEKEISITIRGILI